jgi:fused signal recognition particle receptor
VPAGVGLELILAFVLVLLLVAAFLVGRRLRAGPEPAPRSARPREGLGARLRALTGKREVSEEDWRGLLEALVRADTGPKASREIVTRVQERYEPGSDPVRLLAEEVAATFEGDTPLSLPDEFAVVMVVGVNGTGKTTTIGKLAHRLAKEGRTVAVANSDTFRAAAGEQLETWADRAGADLVARQERGSDPGAVSFDAVEAARARGRNVLIVDTAGRLHSRKPLMDELSKVRRVLEKAAGRPPDEVLLVLDATTGQNGIPQAKEFTKAVGVTGIALTKVDGTARGGIVLAVREELGVPVKLVGTGERLEDLEPFDPKAFADSLVGG